MAYHLEGKDIVINGFEQGVASTPYAGIGEMRNIEIISIPGEAFVEFANVAATAPPVMNVVAYTAQAATDTITLASTTGLYEGVGIVLAANTAVGLSNGVVYYVRNLSGNTFQVSLGLVTSVINITADGTGTLTTYQYGNQRGQAILSPVSYWVDHTGGFAGGSGLYIVDGSNYVWVMFNSAQGSLAAKSLFFLGNIGGVGTSSIIQSGVAIFNGYLILLGHAGAGTDYARMGTLVSSGPAAAWNYGWQFVSTNSVFGRVSVIVSQEDGNMYWTSNDGLGSLIEQPGTTFNPATPATYAITDDAVSVPETDESTCVSELGTMLLIGGQRSFVYVWDKISLGFTNLLNIPDTFTTNIVSANQNAYIFSGNRGRIYLTNGSGVELYKKIPDYVTGLITPIISWLDANFTKNQLIFSFSVRNNANTVSNTVGGVWGIDLETDALRLINKPTGSSYDVYATMVTEMPNLSSSTVTGVVGTALSVGWYTLSGTYVVDVPGTAPYTNYESYLHTDMIPVGTFLDPFSPSQLEWKTSAPLVSGEGVRVSYRANLTDAFTVVGETLTAGAISDLFQANFQKVQWTQLLIELKSTATNPSYARLTEVRIRDWPSGKDNKK